MIQIDKRNDVQTNLARKQNMQETNRFNNTSLDNNEVHRGYNKIFLQYQIGHTVYILTFMRRTPSDTELEVIAMKFIVNLTKAETIEHRLAYHFQKAYFYYLDFIAKLPAIYAEKEREKEITHFIKRILQVLPEEFSKYSPSAIYQMIDDLYKGTPTNGIVVLNESNTRVILAKTTSSIKWSFPKGKINENEKREQCAIREFREEVGINLRIDPNNFIDSSNKLHRFYIVKVDDLKSLNYRKQPSEKNLGSESQYQYEQIEQVSDFSIEELSKGSKSETTLNPISREIFSKLLKKFEQKYRQKKKNINPLEDFKGFDHSRGRKIFQA